MGKSIKAQPAALARAWPRSGRRQPAAARRQRVGLADFIEANTDHIVSEWESFAQTLTPAATDMTPRALRNHIHEILAFIVRDIKSAQTGQEQVKKSQGRKKRIAAPTAAETHAALRLAGGFDIEQMVSEWRALRASVVKLWCRANTPMDHAGIVDLTRFNESIDQQLAESVSHYMHKVGASKDLFIGVLSHDLRTPLNVISMSAQLLLNIGLPNKRQGLDERQTKLANQIIDSSSRITKITTDLLDVTRARFGSGLPVIRTPMDMGAVSQELVDELRIANPKRIIGLKILGNVEGEWDKARIGQVFSNLLGNAVQYGFPHSPICVTVQGAPEEVVVSVRNEGIPIPSEKLASIFGSMTRVITEREDISGAANLGLGLYITKDIVVSHGGTIAAVSSEEDGTVFTARFPRSAD